MNHTTRAATIHRTVSISGLTRIRDFTPTPPGKDHPSSFKAIIDRAGIREITEITTAFELTDTVHKGEKRKDGERDYIVHPLHVLDLVLNALHGSWIMGSVALLHDSLENAIKNGLSFNYFTLKKMVREQIAHDVCLVTNPKCVGIQHESGAQFKWVFADDPGYSLQRDYIKEIEKNGGLADETKKAAYKEGRDVYFKRLLTPEGIRAFVIKPCDFIDNLSDIENLSEDRRSLKFEEAQMLIQVAARMDWVLYELMAEHLRTWNVPFPNFESELIAQQMQRIVICRPRDELDFGMATRELPLQHPENPVISVYMDQQRAKKEGELEIGLPRTKNGSYLAQLRELTNQLNLRFTPGRSLFSGHFDFGARDTIYRVMNLRGSTEDDTNARIESFFSSLKILQAEIIKELKRE